MPKFNFKKIIKPRILLGSTDIFSLESRIFHGISIGLIFLASIYVFYNLYAGLYVGSISAFVLSLIFCQQYYNSRILGKPHSSLVFGISGMVIYGANYFANAGINGSTDLIWPAHLLLVFAISPYKQHTKWLVAYLSCFALIHFIEFQYPQLIQHPFVSGKGQFIDRLTAFPIPIIATYVIIKFIRRSYDRERKATDERNITAEISNAKISMQNEQLEKSNVEKSKLMSIISHDLRAPLVNIKSYLELLTKNEIDNDERLILENALLKSTSSTLEMLSNLLHWSKSQMEGTRLHLQEIDLLTALHSTLEMERLYASKKEIILSYNVRPQITIIADVDMLQLVVRNLISNAIKFTSQGGNIKITAEIKDRECKFTVADNGSGITEARQLDIFSTKTAPSFGTNNEKGVGLGLVLCKEFIEVQQGRIEFMSDLGVGSSFSIYLPMAKIADLQYPSDTADGNNVFAKQESLKFL